MIAVDQDAAGVQGTPLVNTCPSYTLEHVRAGKPATSLTDGVPACQQAWGKPLADGSAALVLVNCAPGAGCGVSG